MEYYSNVKSVKSGGGLLLGPDKVGLFLEQDTSKVALIMCSKFEIQNSQPKPRRPMWAIHMVLQVQIWVHFIHMSYMISKFRFGIFF